MIAMLGRSTRSRLAMLVTACVIPSLILSGLLIVYHYQHERKHLISASISTVHSISDAVDRDLASVASALIALSTSPHLVDGDLATFHTQAKAVLYNLNANNIYLTEATGQQLLNTLRPFSTALPITGNVPLVHRVFSSHKVEFSDLFVGAVARQPLVAIGVPVSLNGRLTYMLGATIHPQRLSDILTQQSLPKDWIASVIDGSGAIIARTRENDKLLGRQTSPAVYQAITRSSRGSIEFDTLDGIPSIGVFNRSAVSHWSVAIYIPRAQLTRDLWRSVRLVIGMNLVALGISLVMAWRQGGKIAAAIQALINPAQALGRSEQVEIPPSYVEEVDRVGYALKEASIILEQSQYEAHHDKLTGLPNRALFDHMIQHQIAICQRNSKELALLYIDLDGFKAINDTHGHAAGDELLKIVAHRLLTTIRKSDIAVRLGGDEFSLLLADTELIGAAALAEKIISSLRIPYAIHSLTLNISASIGIASFPTSADSVNTLILRADEAMYTAKQQGKNCYVIAGGNVSTTTSTNNT